MEMIVIMININMLYLDVCKKWFSTNIYVTVFGKTYIAHTSGFTHSKIHKT